MAETVLEKCARAICAVRHLDGGNGDDGWSDASDGLKDDYRDQARAVLSALREPSEWMKDEGGTVVALGSVAGVIEPDPLAGKVFQAMIDFALAEKW